VRQQDASYKHFLPQLNLSIERNTRNVPSDNKFYLLRDGAIIGNYRSLKKAEEEFRRLVEQSGFKPEVPAKQVNPLDESVERYQMAKDAFWAEGPKYRPKGGPGR
jgi:hypothetical protein